jgi:hypothetical protein
LKSPVHVVPPLTYAEFAGLKRLCHEMNIFSKAYNKKILSVHAIIVFTFFCFLVVEKVKIKVQRA